MNYRLLGEYVIGVLIVSFCTVGILTLLSTCGCTYETFESENPMSKNVSGGWSKHGTLMSHDGGNSKVQCQASFGTLSKDGNSRDGAAGSYTVQFSVGDQDTTINIERILVVADIVWSVNGNDVRRRVSVVNGTSVSGVGESVKVTMFDDSDPNIAPGASKPYEVSITIAPGTRASGSIPPTLVVDHDIISVAAALPAGGKFIGKNIPKDAGVTSVMVTVINVDGANAPVANDALGLVVLEHRDATSPLKRYDPRMYGFVPLAPGATALFLANAGADACAVQITYGIDG